jgi:hypothetical protein
MGVFLARVSVLALASYGCGCASHSEAKDGGGAWLLDTGKFTTQTEYRHKSLTSRGRGSHPQLDADLLTESA